MSLNLHNSYHPFQKLFLGFLLKNQSYPADYADGEIINDIDLYYQPLEKPSIVITFFVVRLLFICIGEGISVKLLTSLKKETSLLTDVTKLFIISQMILHPILLCLELVLNTIYPVNEIIGSWFCFLDWLLMGVFMRIGLNNSFITALMRYLFIVHEEKVDAYGKEKVKRWFLYFSITVPFIQFTLQALEGSPRLSFVKKCYGNDHRVFLIEKSTLHVFKSKFVKLDGPSFDIDSLQEIVIQICKIVEASLFLLMGFNITEVFFYIKIFTKIDR